MRILAVKKVEKTEVIQKSASDGPSEKKAASYSAIDQFIYLIFGIIEIFLLIRFVFRLTGANPAAGIVRFTYSLTNVLMAPFRFIFPTSAVEGAVFEWSILVAIVFYALFAWIIMRLIRIIYTADTAEEA